MTPDAPRTEPPTALDRLLFLAGKSSPADLEPMDIEAFLKAEALHRATPQGSSSRELVDPAASLDALRAALNDIRFEAARTPGTFAAKIEAMAKVALRAEGSSKPPEPPFVGDMVPASRCTDPDHPLGAFCTGTTGLPNCYEPFGAVAGSSKPGQRSENDEPRGEAGKP